MAEISYPESTNLSFNPQTGCFGFLNVFEQPFLPLLVNFFFSSILASSGYVVCLVFHSPLIVANAQLLEPPGAQVLGFVWGLDKLPGPLTYSGAVFALLGISLIDTGSKQREKEQKIESDCDN